jgi:predicted dehydrogenase
MPIKNKLSRREFLATGARYAAGLGVGFATPTVITSRALGAPGTAPASEQITLGTIGCGGQGTGDLLALIGTGQVQPLAVCDCYESNRNSARRAVGGKVDAYNDFRDLLDRTDIDAVNIGTPDHWHAIIAIRAAQAGKDIYCQKPLCLTIKQGRAMVNAVRRYNRVFQTSSQQRSESNFRYACELVQSGRIGKLISVNTRVGRNKTCGWDPDQAPPPGLDWDMYLGPAPSVPFNPRRFIWDFRWFWDYSGGNMTDWGAHHNDIAQWGIGADHTGPVEINGTGEFPTEGLMETPVTYKVNYTYANGVKLVCSSEGNNVTFYGTEGRVDVNRGHLSSDPPDIIKQPIGPNDVHLYVSNNHYQNFVDCVKSRRRPICDAEIGHRSVTVCHLGNISIRLGRKIQWDPTKEQIIGDEEANRWLDRPVRKPWHL